MGTANGLVSAAEKTLGMSGRPNTITRDYASRHGSAFLRAAWCDEAVTYWARKSDNAKGVLPGGDRAYTVWHAQDFQKAGRWSSGTTENTNKAQKGWVAFFDWGGTNNAGAIDHVGIVVRALGGGRVETIEGNTSDAVKRRVRAASVIAGYGRPAYTPRHDWWDVVYRGVSLDVPWATPFLRRGMKSSRVGSMQKCANALGARLVVDNDFGPKTGAWLVGFQRNHEDENGRPLDADEVYGHHSARALALALGVPRADVT